MLVLGLLILWAMHHVMLSSVLWRLLLKFIKLGSVMTQRSFSRGWAQFFGASCGDLSFTLFLIRFCLFLVFETEDSFEK